jgi:hypothetical protein
VAHTAEENAAVKRGIKLLDDLCYAVNSGAPVDSRRARHDWEWWLQWAEPEARAAVAATSPYAKAVVADTLSSLKANGVKVR